MVATRDIEPNLAGGHRPLRVGVYSSRNSGLFMDIFDALRQVRSSATQDNPLEEAARAFAALIDLGELSSASRAKSAASKRGDLTVPTRGPIFFFLNPPLAASVCVPIAGNGGLWDVASQRSLLDISLCLFHLASIRAFPHRSGLFLAFRGFMEGRAFHGNRTRCWHSGLWRALRYLFSPPHDSQARCICASRGCSSRAIALVSGSPYKVFQGQTATSDEGLPATSRIPLLGCFWGYAARDSGAGGAACSSALKWPLGASTASRGFCIVKVFPSGPLQRYLHALCGEGCNGHRLSRDCNR